MSRALKFLITILALSVVGIIAWRVAYPRYEWHQKITVEVDTPEGPVSASSVAEVAWWGTPKILPDASPRDSSVKAEAVVLRLPNGQYLFALVTAAELIARAVLFDPLPKAGDPYLYPASQMKRFEGEVHEIPPENFPLLVTFDDISDPATVKRVDPKDLGARFGPGVMLKRITLQITDERVTKGETKKILGWLSEYYGKKLDGLRYETIDSPNRFANSLGSGDFVTGDDDADIERSFFIYTLDGCI